MSEVTTRRLNWDHVYLLGWYDETGRAYLTTWDGDLPLIYVVVKGAAPDEMPLWHALVPPGAEIIEIPADYQDLHSFARAQGGYLAVGWYVEEPIERKAPQRGRPPAEWDQRH